jgi:hypothetical protein
MARAPFANRSRSGGKRQVIRLEEVRDASELTFRPCRHAKPPYTPHSTLSLNPSLEVYVRFRLGSISSYNIDIHNKYATVIVTPHPETRQPD